MLRNESSGSVLVAGKLNVVGESHNESGPRRAAERRFAHEMTGSPNYWTESEFPDLQANFGSGDEQKQDGASGADLMEYRSANGASLLIDESVKVVQAAGTIGTLKTNELTPDKVDDFAKLVARFDKSVEDFRQFAVRVGNSLAPTDTPEVNKIVQAIFSRVQSTCEAYAAAPRDTPPELRAAALLVATKLADLPKVLPLLQEAVGVSPTADKMRTQRSTFMGLAAHLSQQVGVWKVGNAHLDDLLSGRSKVDMSRANFVTKEDFNEEFLRWQHKG